MIDKEYLKSLKARQEKSRVYKDFQAIGLEIAETLSDLSHKALYIRLAKLHDHQRLLTLAKDIAQRSGVKNRGAYFMKVLKESKTKKPNKIDKTMAAGPLPKKEIDEVQFREIE